MPTTPTNHAGKKNSRFWQAHLDAWRRSGLSRKEYCQQHGLSYHALSYQHRKNPSGSIVDAGPVIVQIPSGLTTPAGKGQGQIRLNIGDRFVVEISSQFDQATLHRLLTVLEAR